VLKDILLSLPSLIATRPTSQSYARAGCLPSVGDLVAARFLRQKYQGCVLDGDVVPSPGEARYPWLNGIATAIDSARHLISVEYDDGDLEACVSWEFVRPAAVSHRLRTVNE